MVKCKSICWVWNFIWCYFDFLSSKKWNSVLIVINACFFLDFLFGSTLSLFDGRYHRPSHVLNNMFSGLTWKPSQMDTPKIFEQFMNYWKIFFSFGRQLSQMGDWAGSEHFVQKHITEPPCFQLTLVALSCEQLVLLIDKITC